MKIKYVKGSLFDSEINVWCHGTNTGGAMGSGVAKIIRADYPEAYKAYVEQWQQTGLQLGELIVVESNGKIIINAMTQGSYGYDNKRYASYDAIAMCMNKINIWCFNKKVEQFAMPMIGAGLGGADWGVIEKIIESELVFVEPVVYQL